MKGVGTKGTAPPSDHRHYYKHSHVSIQVCTHTILYIPHIGMCAILSIPAPRQSVLVPVLSMIRYDQYWYWCWYWYISIYIMHLYWSYVLILHYATTTTILSNTDQRLYTYINRKQAKTVEHVWNME